MAGLQETFYESLLLGADYDWDDDLRCESDIAVWVQTRYAERIEEMDEAGGYHLEAGPMATSDETNQVAQAVETELFDPSFYGAVTRVKYLRYDFDAKQDFKRTRNHTKPRGWKRHASAKRHGRDTIRTLPVWLIPGYTAERFLTENALFN